MKLRTLLLALMPAFFSAQAADAPKTESAVLAGGCFWCTEGAYQIVPGVVKVTSGYTGGKVENPTYKQVCTGMTGHAEAVKIDYDPTKVTFKDLVDLIWHAHDPTTLNRQGADEGTQYRSAIFYANDEQKKAAEQSKKEAEPDFKAPIVTEITALAKFYPAEDYHQNFANENPNQGYVCAVVKPKIEKFKKTLAEIEKRHAERK